MGSLRKVLELGLARDVFSLFWKAFGDSTTIGERVPFVRHDHFVNEWQAIGTIRGMSSIGIGHRIVTISKW